MVQWGGEVRTENRYLQKRGTRWHYVRRVPAAFQGIDPRRVLRVALETDNLEIARARRDAMEEADTEYWLALQTLAEGGVLKGDNPQLRKALMHRYNAARARASARGFAYRPMAELIAETSLTDLVTRVEALARTQAAQPAALPADAEALLGAAPEPEVTLTQAFALYCDEIAVGDLLGKSDNQKRLWKKTKQRAVNYFAEVVGDRAMTQITREDALKFYNWWAGRLKPGKGARAKGANTANRDIGNLRQLHDRYFKYIGQEERPNPFRNLSFREAVGKDVPPFPDDWVRSRILVPGALGGINRQARLIVYALIETGCRPSEIANLLPEHIHLDRPVPYISIRPARDMEIKTQSSIRDIPLVGVSLAAMKAAPDGFPHYRDRNDLLSQSLVKVFRNRGLFPSDQHVIYSFRHSFEKRMLEAGLDYGLRCLLMGHATSRPAYGDGGSLAYRREELLRIVHPYPSGLLEGP